MTFSRIFVARALEVDWIKIVVEDLSEIFCSQCRTTCIEREKTWVLIFVAFERSALCMAFRSICVPAVSFNAFR